MAPATPPDRRPLTERWRPSRLADLVGNARAVAELAAWATSWESAAPPARRAVLLVGPPGVGKTSAAVALAAERGWPLVEMNASEARNQGAIERVAGRASISRSLDGLAGPGGSGRTLVLLDEADCLSGGRTTEGPRPAREPPALRTFLEGRYGTIDSLNAAWGLGATGKSRPFASWSAVPKSPGTSGWAKLPVARRDLDDWRDAGRVEERGDRGGVGAIARLVRSTRQPLVITVNDDRPLTRYSAIFRTGVRAIRFEPIGSRELGDRLRTIATRERIPLSEALAGAIVARARGDLRAALNDLDAVASVPAGSAPVELLGTRDLGSDFAGVTEEVLSRPRYYRATEIRDRLDAPPDDLLPWIEENVPWFAPDGSHREAALDVVAVAEHLLARARRWRTYGLWSYASELLTGGVSLAIRERAAVGQGHAAFPRFLGEMGRSRLSRAVRDAIVGKLAVRLHLSKAKGRSIALPFLEALLDEVTPGPSAARARAAGRDLCAELGLTREEVAAVLGTEPGDPRVAAIVPEPLDGEEGVPAGPDEAVPAGRAEATGGRGRSTVQRRLGD